jgi:hypothetical protein
VATGNQKGGPAGCRYPEADLDYSTFQPSFLHELIFDLALAAATRIGHRRRVKPARPVRPCVAKYSDTASCADVQE